MKNRLLSILLLLAAGVCDGQIITTFAGNGTSGDSGDGGTATLAQIDGPSLIRFDVNENLYIGERSCKVRKISSAGIITTIAGNGIEGYSGDNGPATAAAFKSPNCIISDKDGNVYIADGYNNRVRKINTAGIITTIAGNGTGSFSGDGGQATAATLYSPSSLCFDDLGNLYISDHANLRIRKVDKSGMISTIAGNGSGAASGDGGLATAAAIGGVTGICIDLNGNLYMGDNFARVRKISLSTGIISTVAGNGISGYKGDGGPATAAQLSGPWDIAVDRYGNLYISDNSNYRIRLVNSAGFISTIAGNGTGAYNGDGIAASSAQIYSPRGVTLDSCGNLYIADYGNSRVRKVTFSKCHYMEVENIPKTSQQLSIYPTPTNEILNINNLQTPATYKILNMPGAVLLQGALKAGDNSISIEALPVGMYMLEVVNAAVGIREMRKVVKQ